MATTATKSAPKAARKAKAAPAVEQAPAKPKRKPKAAPVVEATTTESRTEQGHKMNDLIGGGVVTIEALVEKTGYSIARVQTHMNWLAGREIVKPGKKAGSFELVGQLPSRRNG
jgi:hypothetical protein